MDHQSFREELHRVLRNILSTKIEQYLDHQFEIHHQVVRYISTLGRKYDEDSLFREGLPVIYTAIRDEIEKQDKETLSDVYADAVDLLRDSFPEETVWRQDEERFTPADDDSLLVSAGKSGKRIARSISKTQHAASQKVSAILNGSGQEWMPWTQIIPLQKLISTKLLDEDIVVEWGWIFERIQIKIIADIEDFLVDKRTQGGKAELDAFADSLERMLKQKKMALSGKILEDINQLESEILLEAQKVGTIERSSHYYNDSRLESTRKNFIKTLQESRRQRVDVQLLLLDRVERVAQFFNLAEDITQESTEFIADFHETLANHIKEPLCNLLEILDEAIENVNQTHSLDSVPDLKKRLKQFLDERLTEPIQTLLENQVMSRKTEHFLEKLLSRANQAPQEAVLIFDAELDTEPPRVEQKQMEWRQLVIRSLREHLMGVIQPGQQKYEEFLGQAFEDIREIEDSIEVNLESALSARDEESLEEAEHPEKIVSEALKRISAKVDDLASRTQKKMSSVGESVNKGTEKFSQTLLALLHEGDAKELQLITAKYRVKETTKDWRTILDSRFVRAQDRLLLWTRFGWKKSKEYGTSLRTFVGFGDEQIAVDAQRVDIATYLSETDQKLKELPYIYRRLFDFNALADDRFFVPAKESRMTLNQAFEQWQRSYPSTFAVVGEKGSGKSSFLNLTMDSKINDHKTVTVEFSDTIWTEEDLVQSLSEKLDLSGADNVQKIIEKVNTAPERKVVILECVQNCFLRNINGYEAIEKLCYLISETREQIFWAISCSRYSWAFLNQTVQISEYFSHVVMSDTLDADQIKSVILNRHRSSGYTLVFEPDEDTLKARSYRKLRDNEEDAQGYLQKKYFEKLTELAQGNASVAMIFWIRSIREFDDTYLYIQPLEITSVEIIAGLNPQVLFALAAFVLHDTLSDEDLSMVLNMTVEESRLLINRLRGRGLLEEKGEQYTINHLMYRQIVRVLKERNIIHLV